MRGIAYCNGKNGDPIETHTIIPTQNEMIAEIIITPYESGSRSSRRYLSIKLTVVKKPTLNNAITTHEVLESMACDRKFFEKKNRMPSWLRLS